MKQAGLFSVVAVTAIMTIAAGHAAPAGTPGPAAPGPNSPAPAPSVPKGPERPASGDFNKESAAPDEAADARNAARTRMRECGHQWSTMKKSGAASGMTWKDFSQGCLARK